MLVKFEDKFNLDEVVQNWVMVKVVSHIYYLATELVFMAMR